MYNEVTYIRKYVVYMYMHPHSVQQNTIGIDTHI